MFPPLEDPACVLACVDGGGKFVFMDKGDKPLQIANQDFADLKKHPGVPVTLTGELKGDIITITKIELAPKSVMSTEGRDRSGGPRVARSRPRSAQGPLAFRSSPIIRRSPTPRRRSPMPSRF